MTCWAIGGVQPPWWVTLSSFSRCRPVPSGGAPQPFPSPPAPPEGSRWLTSVFALLSLSPCSPRASEASAGMTDTGLALRLAKARGLPSATAPFIRLTPRICGGVFVTHVEGTRGPREALCRERCCCIVRPAGPAGPPPHSPRVPGGAAPPSPRLPHLTAPELQAALLPYRSFQGCAGSRLGRRRVMIKTQFHFQWAELQVSGVLKRRTVPDNPQGDQ